MHRALGRAFAEGCSRVVLIGTDCPDATGMLGSAFDALTDHDIVLGPSVDGGYYLIGLTKPADVFDSIAWSTTTVLDDTLARARREGLSARLLGRLSDVDVPADLEGLDDRFTPDGTYLSVIIPALNEAERIVAAVDSARGEGAEIIVVDGGSTDSTVALATDVGARVIASAPGRGRQMNAGAAAAAGEILLFLHADTILPTGYVAAVFEAMADRSAVGGAFRFTTDYDHPAMRVIDWLVQVRSAAFGLPYGDQGLFVRREVFEHLEGFGSAVIAEDLHFVRRLRRRGRVVTLAQRAITSGRRWATVGPIRTTVINQLVVLGCLLGLPSRWLARLYRPRNRRATLPKGK